MTRFALTFDDGPGPVTGELLDILRDAGVRATFFVLGRNVVTAEWADGDAARARALVVRAMREGHVVGNHTFSHQRPDATDDDHGGDVSSGASFVADLLRCDALLADCRREAGLASDATLPVRLPYGVRLVEDALAARGVTLDPRLAALASLGRTHVHWTGDFADWTLAPDAGAELAARMLAHVEAKVAQGLGAVLDLHDSGTGSNWGYERRATADAVRTFLAVAHTRGFHHFTVPAGSSS
ncbi:MAG: polysaccharide deacetylase family protein [Myxococcales bacterium]|nr:polysaccharide deacetylase family protein [Myxococcales bacterium]